jgi:putative tryptophan/tyrosine transport system substrate-binding protein
MIRGAMMAAAVARRSTRAMTARRGLLRLAGVICLISHQPVFAQTAARTLRLGILRPSAPAQDVPSALLDALREAGYTLDSNLVIERRYASGQSARLPELARELVAAKVDVLVCVGPAAADAGRRATSTIPIIMFGNFDPVALGLVANLARPEANVTGVLISADGTLAGKRIELLRELVPKATRVAMLATADPGFRGQVDETRAAARALGVGLEVVEVQGGDYAAAFARMADRRAEALVVGASTFFMADRKSIIALAAQHRLPAVYEWPEQVREGGLLAYGTNLDQLYARIGTYADLLVRGRKPAELPVEQPATYRLALNLRTARSLGLVVPRSLMLRADEVIQ